MVSLCTIIWLADVEAEGWYHRDSEYQSSGSRRLGALCSWSLSSQHLPFVVDWEAFTSSKQLRKFASNIVI